MSRVGGLRLRAALGGILAVALSLASAPGSTCLAGSPPAERSGLKEVEVEALVSANTAFALDLYQQLRRGEGNLFFSAYSISVALAMTYTGARGTTAEEMARVLHFDLFKGAGGPASRLHPAFGELISRINALGQSGECRLSVANALWGQKGAGFLPGFLNLLRTHYGAGLREVDFVSAAEAARKAINAWVEGETQGRIQDLIPPGVLDALTRLVLVNAIYFKGTWASPFSREATREGPFTLPDGHKVTVPMMNRTGRYRYAESETLQVLELPYAGDDLSMVILLPRRADGLSDLEQELTPENLRGWLRRLRPRRVQVFLPRFTLTSGFRLDEALRTLGMTEAFTSGRADFSGMNGLRDLYISAVLHKAFVEVNEEGTEAAAATAVVVARTAVPSRPVVFRADHPFIFLIRERRSGSILFLGRLLDPKG